MIMISSHLVIWSDSSEFQHELKTQQVVRADGLQLQEFTQSNQLGALQVLQSQLVLKQLWKADDVLRGGLLTCATHLKSTQPQVLWEEMTPGKPQFSFFK